MDEVNKIRKQHLVNGKSINAIATKVGRSWATVNEIAKMGPADLAVRGLRRNRKSILINDQITERINELFDDEVKKKVHKKQRYTKHFIFNLLVKEKLYQGSERYLRSVIDCIRNRRPGDLVAKDSYLDLEFPFGKYLQIDHGEVDLVVSGLRTKAYLFVATVPGVPVRYCQVFLTKASEAWGEFHERSFTYYGGIFEHCMYDNDSVLKSTGSGIDTAFFTELQIHYGFKGINCNKASGWEKGSVENAVGYCRRNFLPGLPEVNHIEDLNTGLHQKCIEDLTQPCDGKFLTEWRDELKGILKPNKPAKEWQIYSTPKVNSLQTITYQSINYSVPERYVGAIVRVYSSIAKVVIYDENNLICEHTRKYLKKDDSLELDHYLDQLLRKPKAILFARVVNRTKFEDCLNLLRQRMQNKYPYPAGDLEFIKTICLKRKYSSNHFLSAVEIAISYGALTSQAVECIVKQLMIKAQETVPLELLPAICNQAPSYKFDLMKYKGLVPSEVIYVG